MSHDVERVADSAYATPMDSARATMAFAALSNTIRLDIVCLLMESGERGMLSGEIGSALEVRANTVSTNLGILLAAGLIANRREGRTVRYFAKTDGLERTMAFLVSRCGGRPELCAQLFARAPAETRKRVTG